MEYLLPFSFISPIMESIIFQIRLPALLGPDFRGKKRHVFFFSTEHDPDIGNTRSQSNKTITSVIFKCRSLLSEFKTMTPVTANDFSTPLALRFIGVQLL